MRHRTGLVALAGMLALAVAITLKGEDRTSALPVEIRAPARLPSMDMPAASAPIDTSVSELASVASVRLVSASMGDTARSAPAGWARLTVGFTRDGAQRTPELAAVVFLPDTVRAYRTDAVIESVSRSLLADSTLLIKPPNAGCRSIPQHAT